MTSGGLHLVRAALLDELDRVAREAAAAREYADLCVRRAVVTAARRGLSQRTIAAHLGRSQPEVHRILKRAARDRPVPQDPEHPVAAMRREERVQYELHRTLAEKLPTDHERLRDIAHGNIARMREMVRGETARRWLDDWERLVDGPVEALTAVMLTLDEYGTDMRQVSPFAGGLTEVERLAAVERASARAA